MCQAIKIDAMGRVMSEHREDSPVDMSSMGRQSIVRFSEVLFDEFSQKWYVVFRDGAPERYRGLPLTDSLLQRSEYGLTGDVLPKGAGFPGVVVPAFPRYSEAVRAERSVLRLMMHRGDFHD